MPFSSIFYKKDKCRDGDCKVNKKNIKAIFKPDDGILDEKLKNELFPPSYKICDCIIVCNNDDIVIVEILCGTLTYKEFKDKSIQLENCYKLINKLGLSDKVTQIRLQYKKLENPKHNPQFRKKLMNPKIFGFNLELSSNMTMSINC